MCLSCPSSRGPEPARPLPRHAILIVPWSPICPPHRWQIISPKGNRQSATYLSFQRFRRTFRIKSKLLGKPLTLWFLPTASTSSPATPLQAPCTQDLSKCATCCSWNIPPFLPLLFSVDLLRQPFPPGSHLVQKASPDFSRQLGTSSSLFPQDLVHIMILYLLLDDYKYLCLYSVSPTKL